MVPGTWKRFMIRGAAACVLLPAAFGQGRGGVGPTGGGTGTATGGPTTGTTSPTIPNIGTTPGTNTTTTPQPSGLPQPIPISGKVLLEDGTAPTETVTIERVCGGSTHAEGYTDSHGNFFFDLGGRNNGVMQDASEVNNNSGPNLNRLGGDMSGIGGRAGTGAGAMGGTDLRFANCDLRAKLAGYRSQLVSLANRRPLDNPDIGVILLHRIGANEAAATVSANDLEVPKDARKAFEKGQESAKKGKLDDAFKNYSRAVELYRNYAAAWFELGKMQANGGDLFTAEGSFKEAVKADPKLVAAYAAIADIDCHDKKWREVVDVTNRALSLDAFDFPQLFFYNAVANYNLKHLDAAEKSVRQAEKLDTRHAYPQINFLIGLISAVHGDYAEAATRFRAYLQAAPNADDAPTARKQLDQVERAMASAQAQEKRGQ